MKTAVVTGATGFIGGALTRLLLQEGVHVYAVGRNHAKMNELCKLGNITPVFADFSKYVELKQQIQEEKIDVFFHCAFSGGFGGDALKDYALQLKNTEYTCDAVKSAIDLGAKRFVFASTVNVIEVRSMLERADVVPRYTCIYSAAKLAAEQIGKTLAGHNGMGFCTALIAMPYGEGNIAPTLPNIVMKQLAQGIAPKLIEGNHLYDLIYIEDVARGLYAIGRRGERFKSYYLGHRRLKTFRALITEVGEAISPETTLKFGEYPDAPAMDYSLVDLDALYRDTGFECRADLRESTLKTVEWLRTQEDTNA